MALLRHCRPARTELDDHVLLSQAKMRKSTFNKLLRYAVIAIGVATILFIVWRFFKDWRIVRDVIQQAHYGFLGLSFVFLQFSLALFTLSWHILMSKLANARNLWQNSEFYCTANFAKNLPTPVWYIGGRAHFYGKAGHPRSATLIGSLIELALHSLTGLQALAWLELISSDFRMSNLLYLLVSVPLIALFWKPSILSSALGWWQRRKGKTVQFTELSRKDLAQLTVLYLLTWINSIPFIYFIARSWIGAESLSWPVLWEAWLVSSVVGYAATVLMGGLGFMREASLSLLLSSSLPFPIAVVIAASSRLILMLGEIAWGSLCIWISRQVLLKFSERSLK